MTFARLPWWFGAIFGGAGLLVVSFGWFLAITQHYRLATYLPVKARILQSSVASHSASAENTTYEPVIVYTYEVQGTKYQASRVLAIGKYSQSGSWASRLQAQYPARRKVDAWYSPNDPSEAFLSREVQFLPYFLALCGIPFVSVGVFCLFVSVEGRRIAKPPVQMRDQWFSLSELGNVGSRFRLFALLVCVWYSYMAVVVGDEWIVSGRHLDLFREMTVPISVALGLFLLVPAWRYWRLSRDFLNAEISTDAAHFQPGQLIKVRLRQGLRRGLRVDELSIGAVCMCSDRIKTGSSVSYPPASEVRSVWKKLEIDRAYPAGGEISAIAEIALPADAPAGSRSRRPEYPIFQWFIVLRVIAEGEPELRARFPIVVEPSAEAIAHPGIMLTT